MINMKQKQLQMIIFSCFMFWDELCTPKKYIQVLTTNTLNVILFVNRVKMWSYQIKVSPNQMTGIFVRWGKFGYTYRDGRTSYEDEDKDWSYAVAS